MRNKVDAGFKWQRLPDAAARLGRHPSHLRSLAARLQKAGLAKLQKVSAKQSVWLIRSDAQLPSPRPNCRRFQSSQPIDLTINCTGLSPKVSVDSAGVVHIELRQPCGADPLP